MIVIRADANSKIGMGHVMRCLAIADSLLEKGEQVCFLTADENPVSLFQKKGIPCRVLQTDYRRMDEETEKLMELLKSLQPSAMLIDSYFVTEEYLRSLRGRVKTVCLDDVYAFSYPVDMLINYNIYAEEMGYANDPAFQDTKLCLGTAYAPLRAEFTAVPYRVRERAEQILLTTGGSDSYNLAGKLLAEVLQREALKDKTYHVVSGSLNPHLGELQELAGRHPNVRIHSNVTNMAELMQQCDTAVSAGGSTMYELSAVGVPTVTFSFAENQERIVETFSRLDYAAGGASYLRDKEKMIPAIAEALAELCDSRELRTGYSRRARTLVDGQGAARIAEGILNS